MSSGYNKDAKRQDKMAAAQLRRLDRDYGQKDDTLRPLDPMRLLSASLKSEPLYLSKGDRWINKALIPTEVKTLQFVLMGLSNIQIATRMATTEQTVKNRVSKIFKKKGVKSRTQLILKEIEGVRNENAKELATVIDTGVPTIRTNVPKNRSRRPRTRVSNSDAIGNDHNIVSVRN